MNHACNRMKFQHRFLKVLDSKTYAVLKVVNPTKVLYNSDFIVYEPQMITSFQATKVEQHSTIPHPNPLISLFLNNIHNR